MPVGYRIKSALAYALYSLGLLQLWYSFVSRRKAVVLMYHRVLTPQEQASTASHPGIVVSRDTFALQMAFLKRRFRVLSLEEFARRIDERTPFPRNACLITFDDGWRDNLTNALPILKEHGLPAVVFLPVNYIGHDRPFRQEALTQLLSKAAEEVRRTPQRRERLQDLLSPIGAAKVLASGPDVRASIADIVRTNKHADGAVIAQLLSSLASELGVDLASISRTDGFMSWDQVHEMSRHGIAFGGHGAEHRILIRVRSDEAAAEIRTSKEVLDARLRQRTLSFAYPNGDWSAEIADEVRKNGFGLAFTTQRGFVSCDDNRFALRRVNIHDDMTRTMPMFLARVIGLL